MPRSLLAVLALAALFPVENAARADVRLDGTLHATRYAIALTPDLESARVEGEETIAVTLTHASRQLVLDSVGLDVETASLTVGSAPPIALVPTEDDASETVHLDATRELPVGPATLTLRWKGRIDTPLRGLYVAKTREGARVLLTQLEATDARRVFPSLDEPAEKARFQLSVTLPTGMAAVSNGTITRRVPVDGKRERVEFSETPVMSTYLLALAAGPLASRSRTVQLAAGPTVVSVWTVRGREALGELALDTAARVLERLEAWFGQPYPFHKLDIVAAPEFGPGGMENVGAIFCKEGLLLVDPAHATDEERRHVLGLLAHEEAHQWFGDLVTMQWWDDLWLNESFATWMGTHVVEELDPSHTAWRDFAERRTGSLAVDALEHTHPVRTPVATAAEAEALFDHAITYGKGAAVLRMLERFLGEEVFRAGVRKYVAAHAFGSARAADLWKALEEASGQPMARVASEWIERPGFPLVDVTGRCEASRGREAVVTEAGRFRANGAPMVGKAWPLPACVRALDGEAAPGCALVDGTRAIPLDGKAGPPGPQPAKRCEPTHAEPTPLVGNVDGAAFARVRYTPPALAALVAKLPQLRPVERLVLVDDQWALARAGLVPAEPFVRLVDGAARAKERDPAVLATLLGALTMADRRLLDGEAAAHANLATRVHALCDGPLAELGWQPRPNETEDTQRLRALAVRALGTLGGDAEVAARARALVDDDAAGKAAALDPTLALAATAVAAAHGDAALFDRLLERARKAESPALHDRWLHALGRFEEPALVERALGLTLTELRPHEAQQLFQTVLVDNPAGPPPAWRFFRAHWKELAPRLGGFAFERIVGGFGRLCGPTDAADVKALFAELVAKGAAPSSGRQAALAVETIDACRAARERLRAPLAAALAAPPATPSTATPSK